MTTVKGILARDAELPRPLPAPAAQDRHPSAHEVARPDIAVLVYDLRASGVVLNAIRIAEAALAAGMATELWVIDKQGPLLHTLPAGLKLRAIRETQSAAPRALSSALAIPHLVALLRRHRPALLFSAGNHVHAFAALGHRLARVPDTKLVGRVSNALAATVPPKRSGPLGHVLKALAVRLERLQFRSMDSLIAVSHELGGDLVKHGKISPRDIAVIPNGVDPSAIARKAGEPLDHPWFAPGEPPVILAIGRLCRQKNFAQTIRAFALLRRDRMARLVILGSGTDAQRDALQRLADDLGVGQDVWFAGYQPNPFRFLARARLFVMTSRWEGASNVLVEALACGLPIVATDCPTGVREVLDGLPTGRLVPVGDATATADAMRELLTLPPCPDTAQQAAAAYTLEQCLGRYRSVLKALRG